MADLQLKHIYKRYAGGVTAVSDFTLDIDDKEFIILVGPSGCGKSTTLRMVAGLEEISEGELYIGGRLVNDVAPKDRDIAMVFQNYALYPHMTVFENMAFGLKLRKTPKDEIKKRVTEAAKILDIEHLLDRKPKALSGGQRQRVAMGRAIVRNPKVFLMDEPLSNLDAKLRVAMRTEIKKLHNKLQTTFMYVTHDQTEAMTMGTRIVVMKDGVIQQVDTPANLYTKPDNVFVAGFIGSPQMNFVTATLSKENGSVYASFGDNKIMIPNGKVTPELEGYIGKEVIVGIRPEDIHDDEAFISSRPEAVCNAYVEVTEMMGAETYLYLELAGEQFTARVNQRSTAKIGDTIKVAFEQTKFISLIRIQKWLSFTNSIRQFNCRQNPYGFCLLCFYEELQRKRSLYLMVLMILFLVIGFVLLVKGADLFVDGACDLSAKLRIPAYIVGLTVVAFGTSLPEAAVSITASLQGSNEIAIGNIIGSNMFNTLVVLGASALFAPVAVKGNILKRDFPFCIGITAVMIVLLMTLNHGDIALTRLDGIILLALFAVFMVGSVVMGKKESKLIESAEDSKKADLPMWKCLLFIIIGFVGVVVGGQLTVNWQFKCHGRFRRYLFYRSRLFWNCC